MPSATPTQTLSLPLTGDLDAMGEVRPSIPLAALANLSITIEYSVFALASRQAMLRAEAGHIWYVVIAAIPSLAAVLTMRHLNLLTGRSWHSALTRSTLVCLSCYLLAWCSSDAWAWALACAVLPLGQVSGTSQFRIFLSHITDQEHFRLTSAVGRFVSGLGRLLVFGMVLFALFDSKDLRFALIVAASSRLALAISTYFFVKEGPPPHQLEELSTFSFPRIEATREFLVGPAGYFVWGCFMTIEVQFFTQHASEAAYPMARGAQYLGMTIAGALIFMPIIGRWCLRLSAQIGLLAICAVPLLAAGAIPGGGTLWLDINYGLLAAAVSLSQIAVDFANNDVPGRCRRAYIADQLFYRYVAGIIGTLIGWGLIEVCGASLAVPALGVLCLAMAAGFACVPRFCRAGRQLS